jgi:hypothetical protein
MRGGSASRIDDDAFYLFYICLRGYDQLADSFTCTKCSPGNFHPDQFTHLCSPCHANTYQPQQASLECSVVRGRPLRSRAVAGVSLHVCICLGPVLASHATSLPAAASAAWRGRGRVHIAGWSYVGVGPVRGLRGGGRRGWCEEWARRG